MPQLVQEPTKIVADPLKYATLIHGDPGVGKTSFCAQMPEHYFLMTEQGQEGVSVVGEPVTTWEEFLKACNALGEAMRSGWKDQRKVRVVVIDSLDYLFQYAGKYICANESFMVQGKPEKHANVDDVPWGLGYKRTAQRIIEKLNKLRALGFGIYMTSLTRTDNFKWRGQKVEKFGPNFSKAVRDIVCGWCSSIGHFVVEEETKKGETGEVVQYETARRQFWQPQFFRTAKHRLKYFPEVLDLPPDQGYEVYQEAFAAAWNKEYGNG